MMEEETSVTYAEPAKHVTQDQFNLAAVFNAQHPMHGFLGNVLEELEAEFIRDTGEGYVKGWARVNPGRFITLICRTVPTLAPLQGMQGDVNLTVNQNLISTSLDD